MQPGQTPRSGGAIGWRRRFRRLRKRARRRCLYTLGTVLIPLSYAVPEEILLRIGVVAGGLAHRLARRDRERARKNLRRALGHRFSEGEIRGIIRRLYRNLGLMGAEALLLWRRPPVPLWRRTDAEEMYRIRQGLLDAGDGLIALTGHLGNWELSCAVFSRGLPAPPTALARRIYYEPFNRLIVGLRKGLGVRVHYRDSSPRDLLRRLARGETVATLVDQDVNDLPGVFVEFFGRPAYTVSGPTSLALRTGTPILLTVLVRTGPRRYRMMAEAYQPTITGDRQHDIQVNTQRWTRWFEEKIAEYPDQWPWFHKRWRTNDAILERKRRQWASGIRTRR